MLVRKIIALLLSPIVLWASMGFSLSRHYCLGILVDEHLYHSDAICEIESDIHDDCHEEHEQNHQVQQCTKSEGGCCENIWLQVEGIDILNLSEDEYASIFKIQNNTSLPGASSSAKLSLRPSHLVQEFTNTDPPGAIGKVLTYLAHIQRFLI